jgi:DNA-directed RNA polymerase subunit RPC12/RpoP
MKLENQLDLNRCPHCNVDKPSLIHQWNTQTETHSGSNKRWWVVYKCTRCGGLITAGSNSGQSVTELYPDSTELDNAIPTKARDYLDQAINSLHAPAGAVMLAASSVDAMLKAKGYTTGNLYPRINQAATDHLITEEMSKWAHEVRLEANDQRHADDDAELPSTADAKKVIDFALALAEFLFVLPSKVNHGIDEATKN